MFAVRCLLVWSVFAGPASAAWLGWGGTSAKPAPHRSGAEEDAKPILKRIESDPSGAPEALFELLGEMRDAPGLRALKRALKVVEGKQAFGAALRALRHFQGVPKLEDDAIGLLAEHLTEAADGRADVAREVLPIFGAAADQDVERVLRRAKDERLRGQTLRVMLGSLAQRGDGEALRLVMAYYRIGVTGTAAELEALLLKFKGDGVGRVLRTSAEDRELPFARRAAAIRGLRHAPGTAEVLVGLLGSKLDRIAIECARALRDRGHSGHEVALKMLAKSKSAYLRDAGMVALAAYPDAKVAARWTEELVALTRSEEQSERSRVLRALEELGTGPAIEAIYATLGDEVAGVRRNALRTILSMRRHDSVGALIEHLAREQDEGVRKATREALEELTGRELGTSAKRWGLWWAAEGEKFVLPEREAALEQLKVQRRAAWERQQRYGFYGLEIDSDQAVFVLDASGSMQQKNRFDVSRIEVAQRQLSEALTRFPVGARFNVIFFGSTVQAFEPDLVSMDEEVRKRVLSRIEGQRLLGGTAVYDALEVAFECRDADRIYLLSDGAPGGGKVDGLDEIRAAVRKWNKRRRRKIVLDCVSVGGASQLLAWLAEDSGGKYIEVSDD